MKPKIFIARGISSKELLDSVFDRYNIKDRTLKYGEYGKPYLASGDLFFNLSHCGDMVVCAVCDREVGVDIQGQLLRAQDQPGDVPCFDRWNRGF